MAVRDAEPADRPRLRAIQTVALAEPWPALLDLAVDGPPLCLVYDDGDPTGYALAVTDDGDDAAYLVELAVARGHRGEGRGSALLAALVERLGDRDVSTLRATVRAVDDRAQEFYADRGFEERERLPDHYETGDGLLLERSL